MGPVNLNTQPLAWSLWCERVSWDPMAAQVSPEPTPGTIDATCASGCQAVLGFLRVSSVVTEQEPFCPSLNPYIKPSFW